MKAGDQELQSQGCGRAAPCNSRMIPTTPGELGAPPGAHQQEAATSPAARLGSIIIVTLQPSQRLHSSTKTSPDQRSYPQRTKLQQNPTNLWQAPAAKPTPTQRRPLPAIPTEASCPNSQRFSFTGKHQTLAPICYIRASAPSSAVAAWGGGRGLHTHRTALPPHELTHSSGFISGYPTTCCAEGKAV